MGTSLLLIALGVGFMAAAVYADRRRAARRSVAIVAARLEFGDDVGAWPEHVRQSVGVDDARA